MSTKYHPNPINESYLIEDFKKGVKIKDLSVKYERHVVTVRNILIKNKLIKKTKIKQVNIDKNELDFLIKSNKTLGFISKHFNCSVGTVENYIKKYNLQGIRKFINKNPKFGEKFNKLTFIKIVGYTKDGKAKWLCKCDCGVEKEIRAYSVTTGKTKSCGCLKVELIKKNKSKGFGDITGHFWSSIKQGARLRKIKFDIEIQYAWEIFLSQNKNCSLSGLPLSFKEKNFFYKASLDRIDSKKGYEVGNIQWVCKEINFMKNTLYEKDFIFFCNKVCENNKK
jgi:hypothetical protein